MTRTAHVDTFARDGLPPRDQWPEFVFYRREYRVPARLNAAAELIDGALARGWGARIALRTVVDDKPTACTYEALAAQVDRIALVLTEDLELVPGNRVLLRGPNGPWLVACWLAVVKAGLIAVATMPLLRARELKQMIDKAEIGAALCDARLKDDLADCLDPASDHFAPSLKKVLFFNDDAPGSLDQRARDKPPAAVPGYRGCRTSREDIALIAFTSGTSGPPKATLHDHRDVLIMADAFARHVLHPKPDDVFCGTAPLAFHFGLGSLLAMPLRHGASSLLLEQPTPEALLKAIALAHATILFTTPTMYRRLSLLLEEHPRRFAVPSLVKSVSAGEPLPDAARQAWKKAAGIDLIDALGSTEMAHTFISAAGKAIRRGAIGKALPGYEARIVDEDLRALPPGTVGRLAVKGPTGCRYLDDARQMEYVRNGWNLTGDALRMDDDGYFFSEAHAPAAAAKRGSVKPC